MNQEVLNPMSKIPATDKRRIVIIGGGFAGLELAKALIDTDYQVVMLDKNNYHTFQPLLYQVATAGLDPDSVAAPLRESLRGENFYFRMAEVLEVIPQQHQVKTDIGPVYYDYLVIATGAKSNFFGNTDLSEKTFTLKSVEEAFELRNHLFNCFERAVEITDANLKDELLNVVIVGGGPTGIEMAGALSELKKKLLPKEYDTIENQLMNIYLVEGLDDVLNGMSEFASEKTRSYLAKLGVNLKTNTFLENVDNGELSFSDGSTLRAKTIVWAAGVKGNVIQGLNEEKIEKSRIKTDDYNRVLGYENIFAIGDVASVESEEGPYPMLAPIAMQQGQNLAKNFKRLLKKKPLNPFSYFDKGVMATIGRNKAVVDMPFGIQFSGFPAWLSWMFIHLFFLVGFRRKMVVFSNWVYNYFTYNKSTKAIIGNK